MSRNSPYRLLPEICRADGLMFTKKSEPKDSAEVSKSLVGGGGSVELEMAAERRCAVVWKCAAGLTLVALAAWLLGLTLVREVQLARVRGEVHALRGELQELSARVLALDKYVEAEKNLVNDLNAYEDEVVADLDSITVMEDSDDAEEIYEEDGEDGESGEGGMYDHYDETRQQALPPEPSLGALVHAPRLRDADAASSGAAFAELRRRLVRPQQSAPAAAGGERSKRSVRMQPAPPAQEAVDAFAAPRFLASKFDERRRWKKYDPEAALPAAEAAARAPHDMPRRTRDSDDELAVEGMGTVRTRTRRSFVAAHFHGNTSHLNPDVHPHYRGNGLVRVAHDAPHNVWSANDWTRMRAPASAASPALTRRGHVHVKRTGVYFVYVQIYYLDAHDITGWVLHRTTPDADGDAEREALLQCASTSPSTAPLDKPNSCFSAAALLLRAGDRLAVRNTGGDRHSLMQPEKSFIGLVKLADADDADAGADGDAY